MMVTNFNDCLTDSEEFREEHNGKMEGQFHQNFYKKILVINLNLMKTTHLIKKSDFNF